MNHREPYKAFFEKSEAGQAFMAELKRLIDIEHQEAEKDPDHARDHTQRACGVRKVLTHIAVTLSEPKKKGAPRVSR